MSTFGAHFRGWLGITSHTVFLFNGEFTFSIFEHPLTRSHLDFMRVILELVLRGTGSGLHQHPTKAKDSFDGAATPVAVAWVATVVLSTPLDYLCAGTCFIFLIEFTHSGSGKTLTPL